jgi:hypothetical protein
MPSTSSYLLTLINLAFIPTAMAGVNWYGQCFNQHHVGFGTGYRPLRCQTHTAPKAVGKSTIVNLSHGRVFRVTWQSNVGGVATYEIENRGPSEVNFIIEWFHYEPDVGYAQNDWISFHFPTDTRCLQELKGYMESFQFTC